MPKLTLLIITLTVVALTAVGTIVFNNLQPRATPKSEINIAVNQARLLYSQRSKLGEDFSKGPCLSNALMPGWVVDLVHNPRQPVDDLPENKCSVYSAGQVLHFVELDLNGDLIRAR